MREMTPGGDSGSGVGGWYNPATARPPGASEPMRKNIILLLAITLVCAGCSREKEDWKTAQAADSADAYQEFMRQHPDSEMGVQAQARIRQLSEDRDWQQAAAADTKDAYEQFVAQHADSKWAQEARVRIENINLSGPGAAGTAGQPADTAPVVTNVGGGKPGSPNLQIVTPAPGKPAAAAKPQAAQGAALTQPAASTAAKPAAKPATSAGAGSRFIQLGAFSSRERAEALWKTLDGKYASTLKGVTPNYDTISSGGRKLHRLRGSVSSATQAATICAELTRHGQSCIVVKP